MNSLLIISFFALKKEKISNIKILVCEVINMIPERKLREYQDELNENEKQIRELVLESYKDIALGKGREYNDFFDELESRYSNEKV